MYAQGDAPAGDLSQARGITGIERVAPAPPPARWPYWLAFTVAIGTGLMLVGWKLRQVKTAPPPLSPDSWAKRELDRIEGMGLPEAGKLEQFHTLVSDAVRRYLELRFELRAPQQTTPEFLEAMRQSPMLSTKQQQVLRDFLQRCDLAKFARDMPTADECRQTMSTARRVVSGEW